MRLTTQVIDSHTAGEPTRVVVAGGPDLGHGSLAERCRIFAAEYDSFRSAVVNEPRGSDVLVGALLTPPVDPSCAAGVIFFNNVGVLGMCGHGTIGVVTTLAYQRKIQPGRHRLETAVGEVTATLHDDGQVSFDNIASYRKATGIAVDVPNYGRVMGDLAWGGNWFFLTPESSEITLSRVTELTAKAAAIRRALNSAGYPEVDHIELVGTSPNAAANARNFMLCPGLAYDRSPCGTGTSAKLACLAAAGKLAPGEQWVQESILGTSFTGSYQWLDQTAGTVIPTITGRAYITAEATLLFDESDPFRNGIR
jgi:4-hydroxyproline epimerase